jgi:hypothetical protein
MLSVWPEAIGGSMHGKMAPAALRQCSIFAALLLYASRLAIVVLAVMPIASTAQTTWQGLKFGINEADVRSSYKGKLEKDDASSKDWLFKLTDHDQKLLIHHATAVLYFDHDAKLADIELYMKDPPESEGGSAGSALASFEVLTERLVEKYGRASSKKGDCQPTVEDTVRRPEHYLGCEQLWRSEGQIIKFTWLFSQGRLKFAGLDYSPKPNDIWL